MLIVSCDTISNVCLFPLLNMFRQHDASVSALFLKGGAESDTVVPGPKTKHKPERDLIGIHEDTQRLLLLASTSDFEESMSLPGHLLRKNGSVCIHSRLVDSHIYVIKKWIVDFLSRSDGFSTLKGELLPYIIKKQMSRPGITASEFEKPFSMVNVNIKNDDIFNVRNPYTIVIPHLRTNSYIFFSLLLPRICKAKLRKRLCLTTPIPRMPTIRTLFDAMQREHRTIFLAFV